MTQPDITTTTIKPICQPPIQIKLKSNLAPNPTSKIPDTVETGFLAQSLGTPNTTTTSDSQQQSTTKRTQKAKHKAPPANGNDSIVLSNSIDEIIGDMVFQEPTIRQVPQGEKVILEQQAQVLQKQKELLEQLQQGIRPGWFIQCVGRRADGKQCTRNIKKGSEFCMGHAIKTAYGRIDIPILNTLPGPVKSATTSSSGSINSKAKSGYKPGESQTLSDSEDEEDAVEIPDDVKELLEGHTSVPTEPTTSRTQAAKKSGKGSKSGQKAKPSAGSTELVSATMIGEALVDPSQDSTTASAAVAPKKRGRRRKLPIDPRFGNNDYIIMWPIICEDQRFLTDRYENIYSNDPARPVFIGVREVSGHLNRSAAPKTC
jgi:hypothetical protein